MLYVAGKLHCFLQQARLYEFERPVDIPQHPNSCLVLKYYLYLVNI